MHYPLSIACLHLLLNRASCAFSSFSKAWRLCTFNIYRHSKNYQHRSTKTPLADPSRHQRRRLLLLLLLPRFRAVTAIFFLFQLLLIGVVRLELLPVTVSHRHGAGQSQSNKRDPKGHQRQHPNIEQSTRNGRTPNRRARQNTAARAPVFDVHAVAAVAPTALPGPRLLGRLCQILLLLLDPLLLRRRCCCWVEFAARGGWPSLWMPWQGPQKGQLPPWQVAGLRCAALGQGGRPTARAGRSSTSEAADARHPVD